MAAKVTLEERHERLVTVVLRLIRELGPGAFVGSHGYEVAIAELRRFQHDAQIELRRCRFPGGCDNPRKSVDSSLCRQHAAEEKQRLVEEAAATGITVDLD